MGRWYDLERCLAQQYRHYITLYKDKNVLIANDLAQTFRGALIEKTYIMVTFMSAASDCTTFKQSGQIYLESRIHGPNYY
jgi:GH43 family beta-xylosidase